MVFWGRSTDNVTSQEHIRYDLYLNGQFDGATVDPYPHQFTMYLALGIVNTIEVYAVAEAGTRSTPLYPATMTIDLINSLVKRRAACLAYEQCEDVRQQ